MAEKNFIVEFIRSEKYDGIKIAKKDKLIVKLCPIVVRGSREDAYEHLKLVEELAVSLFKKHQVRSKISNIDVPEVGVEYFQIEYVGVFENDGTFNIMNEDLDISDNVTAIEKLTSQIIPDPTIGSDICFISFIGNKKECKAIQVATILSDSSISLGFITPEDMGGYIWARDAKEIYNIAYRYSDDNDDLSSDPYIDAEDIRELPEVVRRAEGCFTADSIVRVSEELTDDQKDAIAKEVKLIFEYFGSSANDIDHTIDGDTITFASTGDIISVSTEGNRLENLKPDIFNDNLVVLKELWDEITSMEVKIGSEVACESSEDLKKISEFYVGKNEKDGWLSVAFRYELKDISEKEEDVDRNVISLLELVKLNMKDEDDSSEPIHVSTF